MSRLASLRWLFCLGLAFALVVPAAASSAHSLTHALPGIADAGQDIAPPSAPDHDDEAPAPDRHDGGHDHLLSLSIPLAALFDETVLAHPPLLAAAPVPSEAPALPLRPAEPPPADPPKTA